MSGISLSNFNLPLKFLFFITYPVMSILFYVANLGSSWHSLTVIGAVALMFAMSQIMGKPMDLQSPNLYSIRILMLVTVIFSLFTSNDPGIGVFLGLMPVIIVFNLLIKLQRFKLLVDPKDDRVFALYWFIYVISASIPTSGILDKFKYAMNLTPSFILGLLLGWFGPETLYRFIGGIYGPLKVLILYCVFILIVSIYGLILQSIEAMSYLSYDIGFIFFVLVITVYSMLISRIIFEFFKTK